MTCPACAAKRLHAPEDWQHHPLAGHGFVRESGFTSPEAKAAHEQGERDASEKARNEVQGR